MSKPEEIPLRNRQDMKSPSSMSTTVKTARNLVGFWIMGLCNNFGYVIMLSAAHDLMKTFNEGEDKKVNPDFKRECNAASTGVILLANIIPGLIVKFVAPFIPLWIHFRMAATILCTILGLVLVAINIGPAGVILGVCLVSIACSLGESTLLAYTVFFKTKNVISTWSSGTGAAGLLGSFSYTGLTDLGLTPQTTIYVMLALPVIYTICFWVVLDRPQIDSFRNKNIESDHLPLTFKDKFPLIPKIIVVYSLPYGLVYFFEYFINSGIHELLYFPKSWTHDQQFRYYSVAYQLGVFISRSSMNLIKIDYIYLMAFLQGVNVILVVCEVMYGYFTYFYVAIALILWEGLLGGWAYVNTYRRIAAEVIDKDKEFSMALNSISDSLMIALAGIASLPVHDAICSTVSPYEK